jgi:hypothetical protein
MPMGRAQRGKLVARTRKEEDGERAMRVETTYVE